MRGEESLRSGTGGWLIVIAAVVFAVLMAWGGGASPSTGFGPTGREFPGAVPLGVPEPGFAREAGPVHEVFEYEVSMEDGFAGPSPLESPDPVPMDIPFGADIPVATAANDQDHPSVAVAPDGGILVAYTNNTSPTNRDVYVARSTNGGQTWTHLVVANAAGYDEFDPALVRHGTRMYIFYGHDEAANNRGFRKALSTTNGASWTVTLTTITASPFRDFVSPDGSSYQGTYLYILYEAFCDTAGPCGGFTQDTVFDIIYDAAGNIVDNTVNYFAFPVNGQPVNLVHPAVHAGPNYAWFGADGDAAPFGFSGRVALLIGDLLGDRTFLRGAFFGPVNQDSWRLDAAGYGANFAFAAQFIDPGAGFPNHVIITLQSTNDGADDDFDGFPDFTSYLSADAAGVELMDPAIFASNPLTHLTFSAGGDLGYTYSLDAGISFTAPAYKVNVNTGSTVQAIRTTSVTYSGGLRVVWTDNRAGATDVYFSTLSGYAFNIFDRSPSQGTLNIGGTDYPVPVAFLWATGTPYTATAMVTDPVGPGTQLRFNHWEPGLSTNPVLSGTSSAADVVITAFYDREHYLDISTTVVGGSVSPPPGYFLEGSPVTIECILPGSGPDTRYGSPMWTGGGSGSFTGDASFPVDIFMFGPVTEVCDATLEYRFAFNTQPAGLTALQIDGAPAAPGPLSVWFLAGSSHTAYCVTPIVQGTQRFVFDRWLEDGLNPNPRAFSGVSAPATWTCVYTLEYRVVITPTPSACAFLFDGFSFTGTQTFWIPTGETHSVSVVSPQMVGPDTRYVFASWSDLQPRSHDITVTTPITLDLTCNTEYRWQFDATPGGQNLLINGTTFAMPKTDLWWRQGTSHTAEFQLVQITPDSRRVLGQWQDGNTINPRTFSSITGPGNYIAQTVIEYRYNFDTSPSPLTLWIDGSSYTTPQNNLWWRQGSAHTVQFQNVTTGDTRTVFTAWSDGNGNALRSFPNVQTPGSFIANVVAQYRYLFDSLPSGLTLRVDGSPCTTPCPEFWWTFGTTHSAEFQLVQITADSRRVLVRWSDGDTTNPRSFANVQTPGILTAETVVEYRYQLNTTPTGLTLLVDGNACTTLCEPWFATGSSHTVEFQEQQAVGADERRYFTAWSDGNTNRVRSITGVTGPQTLTVTTIAEYRLTFGATPAGAGITLIVDGQTYTPAPTTQVWLREGSRNIEATTPQLTGTGVRQAFIRWSDANTNALRTIIVSAPASYTAEFQTQYFLTVDATSPVTITCDAADCWYNAGTSATVTLSAGTYEPPAAPGTRKLFVQWGTDASGILLTSQIAMSGPMTASTTWKDQVLVKVVTDPPLSGLAITITADGTSIPFDANGVWVDLGASVVVRVPQEATSGGQSYVFVEYVGGGTTTSTTVTASTPQTLTARYRQTGLFESPVVWIGLIGAIVAALLIGWFLMRRRKQAPEEEPPAGPAAAPPPAPAAPGATEPGTMACPSCGLTIPAVAGPCPICGTEVAPPAPPAGDERLQRLEAAYQSGKISYDQYQANVKRLKST